MSATATAARPPASPEPLARGPAPWIALALLAGVSLELAAAAGALSPEVRASLAHGSDGWWALGAPAHLAAAAALAAPLAWIALRLARPLLPRARGALGRAAGPLLALLGLLAAYLFVQQYAEMERLVRRVTDFRTFYEAAAALRAGGDPYAATGGAYFYPPTFAILFRPLLALPPAGASLAWFAFKLGLLAASLRACWVLVEAGDLAPGRRAAFLAGLVVVAARFWIADLQYGNTNLLLLFLGLAAVRADLEGRAARAGLAQALAISFKVVPIVFLGYFAARGRWRTLAWTGAWLVAVNLGALVLAGDAGPPAWSAYLEQGVRARLSGSLDQPDNQSLWGAFARALPGAPGTVGGLWLACAAAFGLAALRSAARARTGAPAPAAAAAARFFLLGLLASPGSWVVHYVAALPALAVLWRRVLAGAAGVPATVAFVAANVVFSASGWARAFVRLSTHGSLFVLAAAALFAALGRREPPDVPEPPEAGATPG